jgi:hypothetical protein
MDKNEFNFVASLEGVELSKEQIARINTGIKEVVIKEIARIDFKGDVVINERFKGHDVFEKLPILEGIWVENFRRSTIRKGLK